MQFGFAISQDFFELKNIKNWIKIEQYVHYTDLNFPKLMIKMELRLNKNLFKITKIDKIDPK